MDYLEQESLNTLKLNDFKAHRNRFLLKPGIEAKHCPPPHSGLRDTKGDKTSPGAWSTAVQGSAAESTRKSWGQLLLMA